MINVFITGENGLMAKAVELALIKDPDCKVVWGNLSAPRNLKELCDFPAMWNKDFLELDITKRFNLKLALMSTKPDVIINLAGVVGTDICSRFPLQAVDSNIKGAYNVASLAKELGIGLIHFSTTAIFDPDDYDGKIITNSTRKGPKTHYGLTKCMGEDIAKFTYPYTVIVRPTFVFGGNEDRHSAIAKLIKSSFMGNTEVVLLDPEIRKDYMYVDDMVRALVTIVKKSTAGKEYNVSFGAPIKFSEIIDLIEATLNINLQYKLVPEADYLKNHVVDNSEVVSLGWAPQVSLIEGIIKSFESFSEVEKF